MDRRVGNLARAALLSQALDKEVVIFYYTLFALSWMNPDSSQAGALAQEHMPRDYAYGDGAEMLQRYGRVFQKLSVLLYKPGIA